MKLLADIPDYAREEFARLMEIYQEGGKEFDILNKWCADDRMKFVYETLEKLELKDKGYFILAMLDSYTVDLDKFKQEEDLINILDKNISDSLDKLYALIRERKEIHGDVPKIYNDILCCIDRSDQRKHIPFTPDMVRHANATRQTKSPVGKLNKARLARAFIVNLSDNGFDAAKIMNAIAEALNVIYSDPNDIFSKNDVENCIKDLRKKGAIKA